MGVAPLTLRARGKHERGDPRKIAPHRLRRWPGKIVSLENFLLLKSLVLLHKPNRFRWQRQAPPIWNRLGTIGSLTERKMPETL